MNAFNSVEKQINAWFDGVECDFSLATKIKDKLTQQLTTASQGEYSSSALCEMIQHDENALDYDSHSELADIARDEVREIQTSIIFSFSASSEY